MKLQIVREIEISKSADIIYQIISDIRQWNTWSPWIQCEPTAKTYAEGNARQAGQTQTWDGQVIGSGKMTIDKLEAHNLVMMKLEFFKPFKSVADSKFEIQSQGSNSSKVIWTMNTDLPFFMFFFKNMLTAYMGRDFERGLKLLKEFAETGSVVSNSTYKGEVQLSGFQVLAKKIQCNIADLSKAMPAEFEKLNQMISDGKIPTPKEAVGLTYNFDIQNGVCDVASGFTYKLDQKINIPPGYELSHIPDHSGLLVDFYGPYRNLSNPWAMAVTYQRALKKKVSKKIPMYEVYRVLPNGRAEKDIHTQIIVPLRS